MLDFGFTENTCSRQNLTKTPHFLIVKLILRSIRCNGPVYKVLLVFKNIEFHLKIQMC
jgi:hypothetical protein